MFREELTLIKYALLAQGTIVLVIPVQSRAIAVRKGMFDVITFLIKEEVDLITIFGRHPWVLQDLINGETGLWVSFQDFGDQIFSRIRQWLMGGVRGLLFDCILSFKYKFLHLCHVVGFEGHRTNEHGIKDNTGTPDVSFEPVSFA